MNTGRVVYTKLMKVYKGILDENGNPIPVLDCFGNPIKKCNDITNPDYIAPRVDLSLCPTNYPVTTTYNPITTTFNGSTTTENITTTLNCNFDISEVVLSCLNPTYILVEVKTTLINGIVNVLITNLNNTIARTNITVVNGSVFFSVPYNMVGNNIIEITYQTCKRSIQYNIQCSTTFDCILLPVICNVSSTTTSTTTSNLTTTSTTTGSGCYLNSITATEILPNQIKVDYVGANVSNWNWTILQDGTVKESGIVTTWVGNTFYVNTLVALCDGTYTLLVTPSNCTNQYKQASFAITDNICCTIAISSVTNLSPTLTRVVFNASGTGNLNWRIKQGSTDFQSGVVTVVNGVNTIDFNHIPLANGNYTFQLDKGMSCVDTEGFSINTTTSVLCTFTLGTPTWTYSGLDNTYEFNIPIASSQPDYTITVKYQDVILVSFGGSPNGVFTLPRNMSGIDISDKTLNVSFYSESTGCTRNIDVDLFV